MIIERLQSWIFLRVKCKFTYLTKEILDVTVMSVFKLQLIIIKQTS